MSEPENPMLVDPWASLRAATSARIGLGRSGDAIPLASVLAFQHAHARARDAVHTPLDTDALAASLAPLPVVKVQSRAIDRATYLRRPDLGRQLSDEATAALTPDDGGFDIVFVIADGLSATAVQMHAAALIAACGVRLSGWRIGPVVIATQGRVAMLIGERPGLSVAESLGVYLTFEPRRGRRDSERNCISNVHGGGGLSCAKAADKLVWLASEAIRRKLTRVDLKDDAAAIGADPSRARALIEGRQEGPCPVSPFPETAGRDASAGAVRTTQSASGDPGGSAKRESAAMKGHGFREPPRTAQRQQGDA